MSFSKRLISGVLAVAFALLGVLGVVILLSRKPTTTKTMAQEENSKRNDVQGVGVELPQNPDGSYTLSANHEGWVRLGKGDFTIDVKGSIDFGGFLASPDRSGIMGNGDALVPGAPFGVPVGKIGESGKPFMLGYSHRFQSGDQIAYIAVNDSYYADNKGAYIIHKR